MMDYEKGWLWVCVQGMITPKKQVEYPRPYLTLGKYRLFYFIENDKLIVAVIDFKHRQKAYSV